MAINTPKPSRPSKTMADASAQTADDPLANDEDRFFQLIEQLPMVAVQGYDRERRVTYWNQASTRIYGYSADEALGRRLEDLIIPHRMRDEVIEAHRVWLAEGVAIPSAELELRHRDGHTVPVYSSHVLLRQASGACEMFCIDVCLQEQKRAEQKLVRQAHYDGLTGLPNRFSMEQELACRITRAGNEGQRLALLFIDLDEFKLINDTLGHDLGDRLLQAVAARLALVVGPPNWLSHFGGDEFVAILADVDGRPEVEGFLQSLRDQFADCLVVDGVDYALSASIGVSLFPDDGRDSRSLMGAADAAMHQAKARGRDGYCFFSQAISDQLHRHQQVVTLIRQALERDWFQLYYQPQVDLRSGRIRSCEALLRCFPAEGGPVSPGEFIPVAEKSGLIREIGQWVLQQACQQLAQWQTTPLAGLRVDINVSANQLIKQRFDDQVLEVTRQFGVPLKQLGLELTEHEMMSSQDAEMAQLHCLYNAGGHIAIDDFGSGYSSLVYLRRLPLCTLKIDRLFLQNALGNDADMAILEAIIQVGHRLGLTVLVEGVETAEQDRLVRDLGCDAAQGFYYARPMPADELVAFLAPTTGADWSAFR